MSRGIEVEPTWVDCNGVFSGGGGKLHHAVFAPRWRRRAKVKPDSERQTQTSYLQLITTFGISLTVSKSLAFVCGPNNDIMPVSPLGVVVGQRSRRILKGRPRHPFVINYNC